MKHREGKLRRSLMGRNCVLVLACLLTAAPLASVAADNIGALVNASFQTSWTYRASGAPSPPGGWSLAGWAASSGGPQYYTGTTELWNGRPTDNRCKWEFAGSGAGGNNVIAKEINWGSNSQVTITVSCAGRTWAGTNGTMSLGVDANGGGTQWSHCSTTTSRTSNDQSWAQLTRTVSKPGGATTFTVMLNAVPASTTWNCQFDELTVSGTGCTPPSAPGAPVVSGATNSTLNVANNAGDSAGSYFAIRINGGAYTNKYVQANGTVGSSSVWQQKATWGTKTVTGLASGTTYTFTVSAATDNTGACASAWGNGTSGTTTSGGSSNVITNGGFENGFTGGVGSGWTSFKTSGYGATFSDGTDQVKAGSHSQKITANQPSGSDRYAGIYQKVTTVPTTQYTLTAWERAALNESYAGEHLVCKLGYDLTGGSDPNSANVNWQEFDSTKNTWVTLTRTFTATGSQTTVFLQAWRKWASGGTGYVWFDEVSCNGSPTTGTLAGNVKNSSGQNLSGASISTNTGGYSATTNASGNYTISGVVAGSYNVTASKAGYSSSTQNNKTVTAGQTTTVNFTLSPVSGVGAFTGWVVAPTGAPISGATVSTSTGGYSTTTDANGIYTLTSVTPGSYDITATKSGFQSVTHTGQSAAAATTTTVNFMPPRNWSKVGWHVVGSARDGYGAFLAQTSACGKPVALIKCVDAMAAAAEAKSYSPDTLTIGRYNSVNGWEMGGLNGWVGGTPQAAADTIYPYLKAQWIQHPEIDVWEVCNEWDSNYAWQADYYIAMMDKAETDGFRLALFASSLGTPSETVYPDVARACARAKAHGGHILALHEYAINGNPALMQYESTSIVTRYRQLWQYLKNNNAEIPIVITEAGQNGGYNFAGDSLFIQDFAWYDTQMRADSYVLGCAAWTLGNWANANAMTAIPELGDYICNN